MIRYREATLEDLPSICLIGEEVNILHHTAWPHIFTAADNPMKHSEHWGRSIQAENAETFVVENNNQLVGFITVKILSDKNSLVHPTPYCSIGSFVVSQQSRGLGIGRELMRCAERWAIENGIKDIRLRVYDFNKNALNLYLELGYEMRSHELGKLLSSI